MVVLPVDEPGASALGTDETAALWDGCPVADAPLAQLVLRACGGLSRAGVAGPRELGDLGQIRLLEIYEADPCAPLPHRWAVWTA